MQHDAWFEKQWKETLQYLPEVPPQSSPEYEKYKLFALRVLCRIKAQHLYDNYAIRINDMTRWNN